jgi:hypothetical protein
MPIESRTSGSAGAFVSPDLPEDETECWTVWRESVGRPERQVDLKRVMQEKHTIDGRAVSHVEVSCGRVLVVHAHRPISGHATQVGRVRARECEIDVRPPIHATERH